MTLQLANLVVFSLLRDPSGPRAQKGRERKKVIDWCFLRPRRKKGRHGCVRRSSTPRHCMRTDGWGKEEGGESCLLSFMTPETAIFSIVVVYNQVLTGKLVRTAETKSFNSLAMFWSFFIHYRSAKLFLCSWQKCKNVLGNRGDVPPENQ